MLQRLPEHPVTPVPIPATITGDRWPVLSAIRISGSAKPAEFVVIADCGEGTPTHRYATFLLCVWADRVAAREGEYDLTFPEAMQSMAERTKLFAPQCVEAVVVAREPHATDFIKVYVDGTDADCLPMAMLVTCVVYLDPDDEERAGITDMLNTARSLSPAAQAFISKAIANFGAYHNLDLGSVDDSIAR